jgi:DNA-binding PadR family transcriptional regulator
LKNQIVRKLFLGFIHIHILHHAKKEPFFGSWMIEELKHHGYEMSPGTLYPILHNLEINGLLQREDKNIEGKIRKYYGITKDGEEVLQELKNKAFEMIKEINE